MGSSHTLNLIDNPLALVFRTLEPSNEQRPQEANRQMVRPGRVNGSQLNDLIDGAVNAVCARVDRKCNAMQVDKVG